MELRERDSILRVRSQRVFGLENSDEPEGHLPYRLIFAHNAGEPVKG
jgi:hypothetical protein